jgi:hypothetical protein
MFGKAILEVHEMFGKATTKRGTAPIE